MNETTYPIGTIANCNRCDKQFELTRARNGYPLQTTAARLVEFTICPHCETLDCHWVYLRNNPNAMQLEYEVRLLELHFATYEQAVHARKLLDVLNIPTFQSILNRQNVLVTQNAPDCIAALFALADYEHKRTAHPI